MIRLIFTFLFSLVFTLPAAAGLQNQQLQQTVQSALSAKYPGGTTDLRLCTYGECTITTLGTLPQDALRVGGDLDDSLEVAAVLKAIFENAGMLLEPQSRVSVNLRRVKHNCMGPVGLLPDDDDDEGPGCTERKTIEADITIGGGGQTGVCSQ